MGHNRYARSHSRSLINRRLRGGRTQIDSYGALPTNAKPIAITTHNGRLRRADGRRANYRA